MKIEVFKNDKISIIVSNSTDSEGILFLNDAIFGNKGLQYQHTGVEECIRDLINPLFFHVYKYDEIIGFYCLCHRNVVFNSDSIDAYYGRYLVISPKYFNCGYGKVLKKEAIRYAESLHKNKIMFYSYIENNNIHSLNISEKEYFSSKAILRSFLFFRFFPKSNAKITKISKTEIPLVKQHLELFYKNHSLVLLENIGYNDNYFVYKENGEIIAGLQANKVKWNIIKMEGVLGNLLKTISKIPVLNRIIKNNYDFLAIEGIYLKENELQSNALYTLLEAVLSYFNTYTALIQLDIKDKLAIKFENDNKLGLIQKLNKPVFTHLMVKVDDNQQAINPVYISAFDFA